MTPIRLSQLPGGIAWHPIYSETGDPESRTVDATLVDRTLDGDDSAFAELVQRYEGSVLRKVHFTLGRSSEDEDAVQEIFLRAYLALRSFDRSYPFHPWIMRITVNHCIDRLRRIRSRPVEVMSQMRDIDRRRVENTASMNALFDCAPMRHPDFCEKVLGAIMEKMNPRYRVAFVLRELEERDYAEVAETLEVTRITARVLVSRARKWIRQEFLGHLHLA